MSILEKFNQRTKVFGAKIGIGLGDLEVQNNKILNAAISTLEPKCNSFFFFGSRKSIDQITNNKLFRKNKEFITLVESDNPTSEILNYLKTNQISSVVRGNLGSNKFLLGLQSILNILSGGRIGDIGRNPKVDSSIEEAQKVVTHFRDKFSSLSIEHSEILIENAVAKKTNLIIAPDGITGNLIYRTLVHLGGGKAYGAIYMDIDRAIVDTSRVGDISEIKGALILAQSLSSRYQSNSTKKLAI